MADDTKDDDKPRKKGTLLGVGAPSAEEIAADAAAKAEAAAEEAKDSKNIAERAAREAVDDEKHVSTKVTKAAADEAEDAAEEAEADFDEATASAEAAKEAAKKAAKAAAQGDAAEAEAEAEKARAASERAAAASKAGKEASAHALEAQKKADAARISHAGEGDDEPEKRPALYLAEYESPDALAEAAKKVRDAGYEKWDCHTPYPVHGLDDAMGLPPTKLGFVSFIAGMIGLASAVLMIQYMNNWDYPIIIGGKPTGIGAFPSMVPIMFELTILLTGFGTLFGILHFAKLPRHNHPVFESERFEAATDDKFFISIEVGDQKFDMKKTRALLESTEPSYLELVEEEIG